jgi:hypothetical protein
MNPTNWSRPFSRLTGSQHSYEQIPDAGINTPKTYTVVDFSNFVTDMTNNLSSRKAGIKNFCQNSLNLLSDYNKYCLNKIETNILEFKNLFEGLRERPFMVEPLIGNWEIKELLNQYPSTKNGAAVPKKTDIKNDGDLFKLVFSKAPKKTLNRSRGNNRSVIAAFLTGRGASLRAGDRAGTTAPAVDPAAAVPVTTPAIELVHADVHSASLQQAEVNDDDHVSSDTEEYSDEATVTSADSISSSVNRPASPVAQKKTVNLQSSKISQNTEKSGQEDANVSIQNQELWSDFIKLPDSLSEENSTLAQSDSLLENSSKASSHSFDFEELSWSSGNDLPGLDAGSLITEKKGDSSEPIVVSRSLEDSSGDSIKSVLSKKSAEKTLSSDDHHHILSDEFSLSGSNEPFIHKKSIPESITIDSSSSSTFYTADNGAAANRRPSTLLLQASISSSAKTNKSQITSSSTKAINEEKNLYIKI